MLESFVRKAFAFAACAAPVVALLTGCATSDNTIGGTGNYGGNGQGNNGNGGNGQGNNGNGGAATAGNGSGTGGSGNAANTAGGGYLVFGSWHGWAWTGVETTKQSTITPTDFKTAAAGDPLCVSGSVAPYSDYSGVAMVGWNLNQEKSSTTLGEVTPTLKGILVKVTNTGGTDLRLQIQSADGATNPLHRWCAPIPGNGGFIPYTSFNTACWDNTGTAYDNSPITTAIVIVPGSNTAPVAYNFCLVSIEETNDENGEGTTDCDITGSSGEGTGSSNAQYDWRQVTRNSKTYTVQTNRWGDAGAAMNLTWSGVSFTVTQQTGNHDSQPTPVAYPSVFAGDSGGHGTFNTTNLPKQVSALTTVPTAWSYTNASGTYNAAYDVWFSTGTGASNPPSGGYLMVWLHKPGNAQPIGSISQSGASISGASWDVWRGTQSGKPVISYVNTAQPTSYSFDLNVFIKDAVQRGALQNSWYLTTVFAGFEIWSGGTNLKTNNFCVVVN